MSTLALHLRLVTDLVGSHNFSWFVCSISSGAHLQALLITQCPQNISCQSFAHNSCKVARVQNAAVYNIFKPVHCMHAYLNQERKVLSESSRNIWQLCQISDISFVKQKNEKYFYYFIVCFCFIERVFQHQMFTKHLLVPVWSNIKTDLGYFIKWASHQNVLFGWEMLLCSVSIFSLVLNYSVQQYAVQFMIYQLTVLS